MNTPLPLLSHDQISSLVSPQTFLKGVTLYQQGKVTLLSVDSQSITAHAKGERLYQVQITLSAPLYCHCTCPAASYMSVCKHSVAALLAASAGSPISTDANQTIEATPVNAPQDDSSPTEEEQLQQYLLGLPQSELAQLLMSQLRADRTLWKSWLERAKLANSGTTLPALKKLITKALPAKSIWEYHQVAAYFQAATCQIEFILQAMQQLPIDSQFTLVQRLCERFNKVLEQIDDSHGERYEIEGLLTEALTSTFSQLRWSPSEKAQWIVEAMGSNAYFPNDGLAESLPLDAETEAHLRSLCNDIVKQSNPGTYQEDQVRRTYIHYLVSVAQKEKNWREEERVLAIAATTCHDFIELAKLCLTNQQPLNAEDWLWKAKKLAKYHEKRQCQKLEVQIHLANGNPSAAWHLAWQTFLSSPTFESFLLLKSEHQQLPSPQPDFYHQVEEVMKNNSDASDCYCQFLCDQQRPLEAYALSLKTSHIQRVTLRSLSYLLLVNHPTEGLIVLNRLVSEKLNFASKSVYQEVVQNLIQAKHLLIQHQHALVPFNKLIEELISTHVRKINFCKLINEYLLIDEISQ